MLKIIKESIEILIIFIVFLIMFSCLGRILFYNYNEMYDEQSNYAAYNFESFSQSFYTIMVSVSTTNFPMSMVKAYEQNRGSAIFFVVNQFLITFVLLNLIMATFYFYYQNFYMESVRNLENEKELCNKIIDEMKLGIIPQKKLSRIVHMYLENRHNFHRFDEIEADNIDVAGLYKFTNAQSENSKLMRLRKTKIYKYIVGFVDIVVVVLTMEVINGLSTKSAENFPANIIWLQVVLTFASLIDQGFNLMSVGLEGVLKDMIQTIDIIDSVLIFTLGLVMNSITDKRVFIEMHGSTEMAKFYCILTIFKILRVISFLRVIKEVKIILDVLVKSTLFLLDLIGMLFILMLIFSSIGINLFGGVVNSKNIEKFEKMRGEELDDGLQYMNFNDYMNSFMTLYAVILAGWQDFLRQFCFLMPDTGNFIHNYYFVFFFITANLFLLNVLNGFLIDNIVAYLSDNLNENQDESKEDGTLKNVSLLKVLGTLFFKNNETRQKKKIKLSEKDKELRDLQEKDEKKDKIEGLKGLFMVIRDKMLAIDEENK